MSPLLCIEIDETFWAKRIIKKRPSPFIAVISDINTTAADRQLSVQRSSFAHVQIALKSN